MGERRLGRFFGFFSLAFSCYLLLLALLGALGVSWGARGTLVGHSWGALGALEALLGALGALLGRSWDVFERSWVIFGWSWKLLA